MNRDDIIRMAREAGMEIWKSGHRYMDDFDIYQFAVLVAAAEREACAKLVEADPSYDWHRFACEAAAAIRARSGEEK